MMNVQIADRIVRPSGLAALLSTTSVPLQTPGPPRQSLGAASISRSLIGQRGFTTRSKLEPEGTTTPGSCGSGSAIEVPGKVLPEGRRRGRGCRFARGASTTGACCGGC